MDSFAALGEWAAGPSGAVIAFVVPAAVFVLVILLVLRRASRRLREEAATRTAELEARIAAMHQAQSEIGGRIQALGDVLGSGQTALNKALSERLDGMSHRLNLSMGEAAKNTHDNLKSLHERLAVIDTAQQHISDLTRQVTTLSGILANKQSRGAFGQGRMEAIVADGLPSGAFEFQYTLKSGTRPDCVVYLPNGAPPLVIDAKFPLEAYNALKAADTGEAMKAAQRQFRNDLVRHIKDVSEKYLVPGETHDTAFLFVPSESIFAEVYESFDDIVQIAYRSRIVIVSPSLLLLSIQVIQHVLRDHHVREQAVVIQDHVRAMMVDVERLDERVRSLQTRFMGFEGEFKKILISSDKVLTRGRSIERIGLSEGEGEPSVPKLRLVEGDLFEEGDRGEG